MILECCATGMAKGMSELHFVKILRFAQDDKAEKYVQAWPV